MKQDHCYLCGKTFLCNNGLWFTTCDCAKDSPLALEIANKLTQEVIGKIKEIARLRDLLTAYRIDPDRCGKFPKGEQCGLKHDHKGPCKWGSGD